MSFRPLQSMPLALPAPRGVSFLPPLRQWGVCYKWTCSIDGSVGTNRIDMPARDAEQAMQRARGVIERAERVLGRVAYRIELEGVLG